MSKITVSVTDGKVHAFIASPAFAQACWREAHDAFQKLGTVAISRIEVLTIKPVDANTAEVKIVVSYKEHRREWPFKENPMTQGKICSTIIETFWALVRDIRICLGGELREWDQIPDFSITRCSSCGGPITGNLVAVGQCSLCGGTDVAKSDWMLEPLPTAMPVLGLPTNSPPIEGSLIFVEDTAQKTCPSCGHKMELIQGKVLKCPSCLESMPGIPGT